MEKSEKGLANWYDRHNSDAEVVGTAKRIGLNLSRYCENCLKEAIGRLAVADCGTAAGNAPEGPGWCGGWDSNPNLPVKYLLGLL